MKQTRDREKDGNVWVSCKPYGQSTIYGKLSVVEPAESNMCSLEASGGFRVENIKEKSITIIHEDPNCSCDFIAPSNNFNNIHQRSISSIDVTGSGLGVSVCSENKLRIWDTSNGMILRNLEGHVWDVYSCCFFPSGLVVLSAGADMQLKIWSAETGKCPVTLRGHTAAVVDAAIVDRGRNIVSASKDGTARLWDCGQANCLDIISSENGSINCCAVSSVDIDVGQPEKPPSEREIATESKLLILGCENGNFKGIGLKSRKQLLEYNCGSAVNCCCFPSSTTAAFGTQCGKIYLYDLRARTLVTIWEESASAVLCLISVKSGLFCGRADGTSTYIAFHAEKYVQLTGSSYDPIYCIAYDGDSSIYTGCRDGIIRKYDLKSHL